jgi:hypothetical protein
MKHGLKEDEFDIKNYVTQTYSRPVSNYQYRTVEKNKWMAKKPFLLS